MLDIYGRVQVIAAGAIPDAEMRDTFLREFSLILKDYEIKPMSKELTLYDNGDAEIIKMFFAVKAIEGCSKGTLRAYKDGLKMLRTIVQKPLHRVTTNDLRGAIAYGISQRGWTPLMANNYRRYWSAFYTWAFNEKQIEDNPIRKIKAIKCTKTVRMPFTEEEMEKLRNATADIRERAILEFLFSTACRVAEVSNLTLADLNLQEHTAKVLGKGNKERIVYLNAKAMLYLKKYLETRQDNCPAVFIANTYNSKKHPRPLAVSGFEIIVRNLGKRAGVRKVHPHRFRHTAATYALRRGMPIEQVQQMLGHEKIDTTLVYAKINNDSLKANHNKFLN